MTISKTEITTPQSAMDDKFQTQKVDFYHLDAVIAVRRATAIRAKVMASETGETVLKVIVPDSYDPTTAGLPCPARKSK